MQTQSAPPSYKHDSVTGRASQGIQISTKDALRQTCIHMFAESSKQSETES